MSAPSLQRTARFARRCATVLALCVAGIGAAQAQAAAWTAEFTVRLESAGKRPVTSAGAKTAVSGSFEWSSTHELRGTLAYNQRLRGAVARNQPDRNNETRYESWLARVSSAGTAAQLTLHSVRSEQSSGRVIRVDGEGAAAINRDNAAKIGKVEHVRTRTEVKVEGADAAKMGGAYLQIDRVANQIRFETPTLEINPARATVVERSVARLEKAPAASEWDRNDTFAPKSRQELRLPPQMPYPVEFVFDVPAARLVDAKEITLTQEFKAGFVDYEVPSSRGVITIVLRRGGAAAATGAAPAAASAPPPNAAAKQADSAPAPAPAPAAPTAPTAPTAQDAAKAVDKLRGVFGR